MGNGSPSSPAQDAGAAKPKKEGEGRLAKLTAVVLGVGALVGAVAGIVKNLDTIIDFIAPDKEDTPIVQDVEAHAHECITINEDFQPVIPLALRHNLAASESFYWLKLTADNKCPDRFTLEVTCDPVSSEKGVTCSNLAAFQVQSGEKLTRQIDPDLEFQGPVTEEVTLKLRVMVKDQRDDPLFDDTLQISVLPQTTYFWDLKDTSKEAVLASLATWTVRPRASVGELSDQLARDYSSLRAWMEQAYGQVLSRVQVVPDAREIPPRLNRMRIESPEQVLNSGRANPVETALLFGALGYEVIRDFGARIVLISAPPDGTNLPNIVFVAWEEQGKLKALNISLSADVDFEEAALAGTEQLDDLLTLIDFELSRESSSGVFIHPQDERVVALDLGRVMDYHKLFAGLPYQPE